MFIFKFLKNLFTKLRFYFWKIIKLLDFNYEYCKFDFNLFNFSFRCKKFSYLIKMAYEQHNMTGYVYPEHQSQPNLQTDENRNENDCGNKEICPTISRQSSGTQTVQKVDASTMTDPLQIDFKLTSEYLAARCAANNSLIHNCQEIRPKIEYDSKSHGN